MYGSVWMPGSAHSAHWRAKYLWEVQAITDSDYSGPESSNRNAFNNTTGNRKSEKIAIV